MSDMKPRYQQGVALVLVMWMVAALTLIVVAASGVVRIDNRLVRLQLDHAEGHVFSKGVVYLAMRDMELATRAGAYSSRHVFETEYQFGDNTYQVIARPVNGLVNLNGASEALLMALFETALDLDEEDALVMAHRIMDWRDPEPLKRLMGADKNDYEAAGLRHVPRGEDFWVLEDLMQVMGVNINYHAALKDLVTVHGSSQGVNPAAAPVQVLEVLSGGDASMVAMLEQLQEEASAGSMERMTAMIPRELVSTDISRDYRVDIKWKSRFDQERHYRFWLKYDTNYKRATNFPWRVMGSDV